MKLAFTGHTNIEKAYNAEYSPNVYNHFALENCFKMIQLKILYFKEKFGEVQVISGMARGVDEVAALVAIKHNLNLILAIPHSVDWHKNRKDSGKRLQAIYYNDILNYRKAQVFEVKKNYGEGHIYANFARNAFMVDLADQVVSFKAYDSTGTDHCIAYAKKRHKYHSNIKLFDESW